MGEVSKRRVKLSQGRGVGLRAQDAAALAVGVGLG